MDYKIKKGKVLVLRTSKADGTSYNRFKWPEKGKVTCPDFEPTKECGHGLHGALWGEGDGGLFYGDSDAIWQVVEVNEIDIVDLGGKVKFPSGNVVYSGDRLTATNLIMVVRPGAVIGATVTGGNLATVTGGDWATVTGGNLATVTGGDGATVTGGNRATVTGGDGATVTGGDLATVTGGDGATVTGGDLATVTGGDGATVTGGDLATVTGGDRATVTGGDGATVTGGDGATVTGGDLATVTGGDLATVTGGDRATVTGGDGATVTGGDGATVTGGDLATVTGGDGATVTGGDRATVVIKWWDGIRYRLIVGYVGEDGIEANTPYIVVDGKLRKK